MLAPYRTFELPKDEGLKGQFYLIPKGKHEIKTFNDGFTITGFPRPLGRSTNQVKAGQAAWALGEIGPDALEAVPVLLEVLQEPPNRERPEIYDGTDDMTHNLGRLQLRQRSVRRNAIR